MVLSTKTGASEVLKRTPKADFWDTHKLANHILSLKNNPKLRERVIKFNRKDVSSLSWERAAAKVKELYESLFAGN